MNAQLAELLEKLHHVSLQGPLRAVGHGATSVGATLIEKLGMSHTSRGKSEYKGIIVSARRATRKRDPNRVNLFAKVPNWAQSECKSSAEILARYGYKEGSAEKLCCSVGARRPNSQGLMLRVDRKAGVLKEVHKGGSLTDVALWSISDLESRLHEAHPESIWVAATPLVRDGEEYFHYRYATHTGAPRQNMLATLIEEGTVTMDHLIYNCGRVIEKGPLFKIKPANMSALFTACASYDLLSM